MLSTGRNNIAKEGWEFGKVTDFSIFNEFDCGKEDLNDFIWNDAHVHTEELIAETYYFKFSEIETPPLAFVSLLNDSIKLTENRQRKLVPNRIRHYPDYPAVKIGRLGIMSDYQGLKIGTTLVDIIKGMFTTNNRTGCRFLTVEAYNQDNVLEFYKKNDFKFFPGEDNENKDTSLMYFDLKGYEDRLFQEQ